MEDADENVRQRAIGAPDIGHARTLARILAEEDGYTVVSVIEAQQQYEIHAEQDGTGVALPPMPRVPEP